MTKLQGVDIIVCTFCYEAHMRWSKNKLPFNKGKKEAVQICFCCKKHMCQDCVDNSQEELHGHILGKIGLDICYNCIATVRRTKALKPLLERAAKEARDYLREKVEIELYTITHDRTGVQ